MGNRGFARRLSFSTGRVNEPSAGLHNGREDTANPLSNAFRKVFCQIGVDGCSMHGLRKNAAVALPEVGCEPHEIMAITGHRTPAMVTHYTKRANQKRLSRWKSGKSRKVANQRTENEDLAG
jgi:integrase